MSATIKQIRALVNDYLPNNIFDDSHYDTLLSIDNTVYGAATLAAQALAAHYSLKVDTTVGPVSIKNSQKYDHYNTLATKYEKLANSGANKDKAFKAAGAGAPALTGVSNSEIEDNQNDDDRYKPAFYRGVTDNPTGSDNIVDSQYEEHN